MYQSKKAGRLLRTSALAGITRALEVITLDISP